MLQCTLSRLSRHTTDKHSHSSLLNSFDSPVVRVDEVVLLFSLPLFLLSLFWLDVQSALLGELLVRMYPPIQCKRVERSGYPGCSTRVASSRRRDNFAGRKEKSEKWRSEGFHEIRRRSSSVELRKTEIWRSGGLPALLLGAPTSAARLRAENCRGANSLRV